MSINRPFLKTLAEAGVNIEIQDGLRPKAIIEIAEICIAKGGTISINSKLLNTVSARKLAELGGKNINIIYNEELPIKTETTEK